MSASTKNLRPTFHSSYRDEGTRPQAVKEQVLDLAIKEVHVLVPPLWPLRDYVAVNPFAGLADKPFLKATQFLNKVRDCDLLMPRTYFKNQYVEKKITQEELTKALERCQEEYPKWFKNVDFGKILEWLEASESSENQSDSRIPTISEALDDRNGSTWSSHILNDITRHCSSHYDEGQAAWPSPWKNATLFSAWRESSILGRRMDMLGLQGFRDLVSQLPSDPKQALFELLTKLEVPTHLWVQYLLASAFSVPGWASFIRYKVREAESKGDLQEDLTGLLAIRLAYDASLASKERTSFFHAVLRRKPDLGISSQPSVGPGSDMLIRYLFQVATEEKFRTSLFQEIASKEKPTIHSVRKKAQMVFCIDVRSEVFRRSLEALDGAVETLGFAGFFGLPMEYYSTGSDQGVVQCPVLVKPSIRMHEIPGEGSGKGFLPNPERKVLEREVQSLWETFKKSATTCFSFVESFGLGYIGKLLYDSVLRTGVKRQNKNEANIQVSGTQGFDLTSRVQVAENLLRNLGLTHNYSPLVIFCGHSSAVTNNPYRAALDCGACGGHSGEPNARVAAALLNEIEVRAGLRTRGIDIPEDTWFIPAIHNTTTDEVVLLDTTKAPQGLTKDLAEFQSLLNEAGKLSRLERGERFTSDNQEDFFRRSNDWSEVRPEWGLAGNAAFIIAPRSRTFGLNLGGRTFLHGYDHRQDPDLRVLELILTAPMVVTNWINLQYYASTVDPKAFGSGNKVIHNVVGGFGILQGNGGDLMTGLPLQCIHDGKNLRHDPLRLTVLVEAPCKSVQTILTKHPNVANLVTNGWISLYTLDQDRFYRWDSQGQWQEYDHQGKV